MTGNVIKHAVTPKRPSRQRAKKSQKARQMIRFMKNIVYKIPPGGTAKPLVAHSLYIKRVTVTS